MVISLCCDHFNEVIYDFEKCFKEAYEQKGSGAPERYAVLWSWDTLAAPDEWIAQKEQCVLPRSAWPLTVT